MTTNSSGHIDNNALADQYIDTIEAEEQQALAAIQDYVTEEELLAPFQALMDGYNNATENWDVDGGPESKTYWVCKMILLLGSAGYNPALVQQWMTQGEWTVDPERPNGWFNDGGREVYTNVDWGSVIAGMNSFIGKYQGAINQDNAALQAMGVNLQNLEATVNNLIMTTNGSTFHEQDISNMLSQLIQAMKDEANFQLMSKKVQQDVDGNADNKTLAQDAIEMMQASTATLGDLLTFQSTLSSLDAELVTEAKDAEADKDKYSWLDGMTYFLGSERDSINNDNQIIDESNQLQTVLGQVLGQIGPVIAQMQNQIYETATLTLNQIVQKIIKILFDPNMSDTQKADAIKVLFAVALGLLAMIESDAAEEKAENQKTASSAAIYTVQMNLADEKAALDELQEKLEQADRLTKIDKVAKPLMDVAGMLFAPGVGAFLLMLAITILDNIKMGKDKNGNDVTVMDKAQEGLADKMGSQIGAEVSMAAMELVGTASFGQLIDVGMQTGVKAAADAALLACADLIKQAVATCMESAEKAGVQMTAEELASMRAMIQVQLENVIKESVQKMASLYLSQAGVKLIPQLMRSGVKELIQIDATQAAKEAVELASEEMRFGTDAAGKAVIIHGDFTAQQAVNKAVANATGEKLEAVASATASTTLLTKAVQISLYNAAINGNLSWMADQMTKKLGASTDQAEKAQEAFKVLEQVLASLLLSFGKGMSTSIGGSATAGLLMDVGNIMGMTGTGMMAVSNAGQGEILQAQAPLIKRINDDTVSTDMMQNLMDEFNTNAKQEQNRYLQLAREHQTDFTVIMHLEDSGKQLAKILSQQVV